MSDPAPAPVLYSTAVYPYPEAMWDEAADHLTRHEGWETVLIVCPDPPAAEATAVAEMADRGISCHALVVRERFSMGHRIRVSRLQYLDPRWDDVVDHLNGHSTAALVTFDYVTADPNAIVDEARAAMAERGIENVAVGLSLDETSRMAVLRVERAG